MTADYELYQIRFHCPEPPPIIPRETYPTGTPEFFHSTYPPCLTGKRARGLPSTAGAMEDPPTSSKLDIFIAKLKR